ncbi:MAG: hypothetical protein JST54_34630 [Deltaproteobacteria bacterium]|nr:hypothetical protein [Deltaproteobacteria bacterium]
MSGTSSTSTSGTSASSGTSGVSCPGYADPSTPASCPCGNGHICAANGCYNGYFCDLGQNRCVAPPANCSGSSASTTGTGSASGASSGTTSGSGTTASSTGTTGGTGHTGLYRVMFDAAHEQVAGNACWIVDSSAPNPQPSNPTSETSWSGGISAWGFDLYQSGRYAVTQLPQGTTLNWGQGGAGDLSQVDVFVSDEPEIVFSSQEQAALMSFANAGGGIFLISDHSGAVRCGSCTEATQVISDFLTTAGSAFGAACDNTNVGGSGLVGTVVSTSLAANIGTGPFGSGSQLTYHSGSTVSVTGSNAQVAINSSAGGMMVLSTLTSGGRLVLVGDSSPEEDGTSSTCSATLYNGWGETDDRVLILNATAWLAHDGS